MKKSVWQSTEDKKLKTVEDMMEATNAFKEINTCEHCHEPINIRNGKGYCDHLYYPSNCDICMLLERVKELERKVTSLVDRHE